jgi:hypothetical protein
MTDRHQIIKEIENLPPDLVEEVSDFIAFIRKKRVSRTKKPVSWSDFSLSTGAFDFWNDPEEEEYTLRDMREKYEIKSR